MQTVSGGMNQLAQPFLPVVKKKTVIESRLVNTSTARQILEDWWAWEIFSFAVAIGMFSLYLYLLSAYDERPISEWETHSNLSNLFANLPSAVSFITTLMRGAMLFPVGTAIGQLKWHNYRQPRRVTDFEAFDGASRGMLGCITLILSRLGWHFVCFGSLVTIATLLVGPFLQNTIRQELRSIIQTLPEDALLPVSRTYEAWDWNDQQGDPRFFVAKPSMQAAISSGWSYYLVTEDIQPSQILTTCSSGLCTWRNVTTLGLGFECTGTDATIAYHNGYPYFISKQANVTNLRDFGSGDKVIERLTLKPSKQLPSMSAFTSRRQDLPLLAHVGIIGDYWGNGTASSLECALYWTSMLYEKVVFNGTRVLAFNSQQYNRSRESIVSEQDQDIIIESPFPCRFNESASASHTPIACNLTVKWQAHRGLQNSILPFIEGGLAAFVDTGAGNETTSNNWVNHSDDYLTNMLLWSWHYRVQDEGPEDALLYVMEAYLRNTAFFISNHIRTQSNLYQSGTVSSDKIVYSIKKHYSIYPGLLLLASVIFVAITVWRTRHEPVWKNAQLPLLYHGFEIAPEAGESGMNKITEMENAGWNKVHSLRDDGDGLGLKLRDRSSMLPLQNMRQYTSTQADSQARVSSP